MPNQKTRTRQPDASNATLPPASSGPPAFTKDDYEELARFRYGLRRFLRFSELALRHANLRPQQYQLLLAIKGFPGRDWVTIGEAAERLQIRHNSAVGLAHRCEKLGLVRREPHASDRRVIVLKLTDEGEKLLSQLVTLHRDELQHLSALLQIPGARRAEPA
jgi:DNA-binding MarR family transcriptional regulator